MILISRLLFLVLCSHCISWPAYADRQEALDNLRKRIEVLQQKMEKTSESKAEAADALRESERAISNCKRKLFELSSLQDTANRKLDQLQNQQHQLKSDLSAQQTLLGRLLYQQYLAGNQEYLKLLMNAQDPNQVYRNLAYYQYLARERSKKLDELNRNLSDLDAISASLQAQLSTVSSLRAEQAEQKKVLEKQQRARKKVLAKVSYQLRKQRGEIHGLQRDETRLSKLVEDISNMLSQPRSFFHNEELPDDRFDGKSFDQLRNKLVLPVRGTVTNRFGASRPEGSIQWKGLFIKSSSGQPVKAIAAGRVVYADWLRGFGNLLIIDHGNGYMSLYGYNETLLKQVGDELHGGDTIATVGNSGGNEDFGLYFELRYQSRPLDPMKWLASK